MGGGSGPNPKIGAFTGPWGNMSSIKQKGVTSYSLTANRQRPLAGAFHNAIFNTYRRAKAQILYVVPPFVAAYAIMHWATEKNEFLNSKEGRALYGDDE
ncbi:UcrQ [Ascosphaera apis ARSEF 7405]|uniref:Cytochrome b-c1 complex subunit 8 n=1 Tax=Ascosphaera apis ARSEF 7405 TaxID=392613 RepID=A0A162IPC4_9EURO|nr:UcrQ [Ascosphaera apis ARSEF 7405]